MPKVDALTMIRLTSNNSNQALVLIYSKDYTLGDDIISFIFTTTIPLDISRKGSIF